MSESSEKLPLKRGVIVEFDYAVLPGHRVLIDACGKVLSKYGVKLDEAIVKKSLLMKSFAAGLNSVCEAQGKTVDISALVAECQEAFTHALSSSLQKKTDEFVSFLDALLKNDLRVVLLTRLEPSAVSSAFGFAEHPNLVIQKDHFSSFGFINWDQLHRSVRKNALYERVTVSLCASGPTVKSSLICGMGAIVKPDDLTAHQDFTGADRVVDAFSADLVPEILTILRF